MVSLVTTMVDARDIVGRMVDQDSMNSAYNRGKSNFPTRIPFAKVAHIDIHGSENDRYISVGSSNGNGSVCSCRNVYYCYFIR